ncbi:MAG: putative Ig domain-containing protein [Candidatus Acidiferrales bacterium]
MKNRASIRCLLAFLVVALIQFSACSGTPSTYNQVSISPNGTVYLAQGGSIPLIAASVLNDTALNGGVVFTALPAMTGTLTQDTSTTASYVAPVTVTVETVVVISATSVDYPKQSASLTVKVEPPPMITTTTLPTATLGQPYTGPITATGGVPPLAWSLTSGTLPAGLTLGSSKTDTVNVTGKATTAGSATITVTVTDATGATSTSGPLTIVVSNLAFTTTSPLPTGTVGTAYVGVQFAATGGDSPYTFTLATGSNLPPGLSLTGGDLTGTPTTVGNYSFGITVTDSGMPAAIITNTFTLAVNPVQDLPLLTGNYAFSFSGYNTAGFLAAAGAFTADGNGNITAGEADFTTLKSSSNFANIKGTYTAGMDGRGTITFTNVTGVPTFAFSIDTGGSGHGRLIEFDSTGTRGSGRLEAQSVSTCVVSGASTTYSGNFAFGGSGYESSALNNPGIIGFAGSFTALPPIAPSTTGSIGPAEWDVNVPGSAPEGSDGGDPFSGTYQSGADSTHCTFQLSTSISALDYDVYPISATDAFLIETDTAANATTPYVSLAEMKLQTGQPFIGAVLTGPMAGGVSGQVLGVPYVSVLQLAPQQGATTFSLSLVDNEAGTVTGTSGNPFSVTYTSDQYGRVYTGFEINTAFEPVLYLIDSQDAFVMGQLQGAPMAGEFLAQSKPAGNFTTQFIAQNTSLVEGTVAPAVTADRNFSGYLSFDASVTPTVVSGTQDESTTSANTPAETVTGSYALTSSGATDGSGTVTLTSPAAFTGAFYYLSPTKLVMITTTRSDTNPVLVIVGR